MTAVRDPRLREGGYTLTREIPGVGTLVFEDYPPGTWLTQKGEPAKIARSDAVLSAVDRASIRPSTRKSAGPLDAWVMLTIADWTRIVELAGGLEPLPNPQHPPKDI